MSAATGSRSALRIVPLPAAGDKTRAAQFSRWGLGGRCIPPEPGRFATLIVAFRSEYSRYSSLTRLVSRAPHPPRRSRGFHHRLLAGTIVACTMCAPALPPPDDLEDILGRFRRTFEEADASHLEGLYPAGWALVALPGEAHRSAAGDELRRELERFFRNRTPISYQERPPSIRRSADGGYVLFVPEWTSMATGTDRYVVEAFRIGLERVAAEAAAGSSPGWQIREFTAWTR